MISPETSSVTGTSGAEIWFLVMRLTFVLRETEGEDEDEEEGWMVLGICMIEGGKRLDETVLLEAMGDSWTCRFIYLIF